MRIIIHKGASQIGGNTIEIGTKKTKIIFDCGQNLPPLESRNYSDDFQLDGLTKGEKRFDGVFISHYHNDHCGLLNNVLADIPVYSGTITQNILEIVADFTNTTTKRVNYNIKDSCPIEINDIQITPIRTPHSAYDAYMFLISAENKTILYTGDYKQADKVIPQIKNLTTRPIDVILTEGTNILTNVNGRVPKTEEELSEELTKIMKSYDGMVFVLCSSTNIDRINAVYKACMAANRRMVQDLFAASVTSTVGCVSPITHNDVQGLNWIYVGENKNPRMYKHFKNHVNSFRSIENLAGISELCFLIRPSMLKVLKKLNEYKGLQNSVLVYSLWSGYKIRKDVAEMITFCENNSIAMKDLHISGHACSDEIMSLIEQTASKTVIPIHCNKESKDLFLESEAHCVMLEDGDIYEF